MNLPLLIRAVCERWLKKYGLTPKEINDGECEDFAAEIVESLVRKGELRAVAARDDMFTREGVKEGFWRHVWESTSRWWNGVRP